MQTKTDQAVALRAKGKTERQIASAIGSTPGSVKAMLWRVDNLKAYRKTQVEMKSSHRNVPMGRTTSEIADWWRQRGY